MSGHLKTDSKDAMPKIKKKSWLLHAKILHCIKKGMYASQIARQLNMKRTAINYHINQLQAMKVIELDVFSSMKIYKPSIYYDSYIQDANMPKTSLPSRKSRIHSLRIVFPILEDNPNVVMEKMNKNFKNWIPQYATIKFPIGITIEKTTKNIVAMFHEFETKRQTCFTDFFSWTMRGTYYVYYYLMKEYGIKIDLFNPTITHQHLANADPDLKGKVDGKQTTEIALQRKARGFFKTKLQGKAWMDFSTGRGIPDIETNDMLYQERLLLMPETLHQLGAVMVPMMERLTEQVNLHLEIQRETLKTMQMIQKAMKKMNGG